MVAIKILNNGSLQAPLAFIVKAASELFFNKFARKAENYQ